MFSSFIHWLECFFSISTNYSVTWLTWRKCETKKRKKKLKGKVCIMLCWIEKMVNKIESKSVVLMWKRKMLKNWNNKKRSTFQNKCKETTSTIHTIIVAISWKWQLSVFVIRFSIEVFTKRKMSVCVCIFDTRYKTQFRHRCIRRNL